MRASLGAFVLALLFSTSASTAELSEKRAGEIAKFLRENGLAMQTAQDVAVKPWTSEPGGGTPTASTTLAPTLAPPKLLPAVPFTTFSLGADRDKANALRALDSVIQQDIQRERRLP